MAVAMMYIRALALVLLLGAASGAPITAVPKMLQEMKNRSVTLQKEETVEFAKGRTSCASDEEEATKKLEELETEAKELDAAIETAKVEVTKLTEEITGHETDISTSKDELSKLRSNHDSEVRKLAEDLVEFNNAISTCTKAQELLANQEKAKDAVSLLDKMASTTLVKSIKTAFQQVSKYITTGKNPDLEKDAEFLNDLDDHNKEGKYFGTKDMSVTALLTDMIVGYKVERQNLLKRETAIRSTFTDETAKLEDQMDALRSTLAAARTSLKETSSGQAEKEKELKNSEGDIQATGAYLAEVKEVCEHNTKAYAEQEKMRKEEIEALDKALTVMETIAPPAEEEQAALVQNQKGRSSDEPWKPKYDKVIQKIIAEAKTSKNSEMNELGLAIARVEDRNKKVGNTTEVKANETGNETESPTKDKLSSVKDMISKLVTKMEEQAAQQAGLKAWCAKQMDQAEEDTADAKVEVKKHKAKLQKLKSGRTKLDMEISELNSTLLALPDERVAMVQQRQEESETNQKAIDEGKAAKDAIPAAIKVLRDHFEKPSFLQVESQKNETEEKEEPKVSPKKYEAKNSNAAGKNVIALLQDLEEETIKMIANIEKNEADAASGHTKKLQDHDVMETETAADLKNKKELLATTKDELNATEHELSGANEELDHSEEESEMLIKPCMSSSGFEESQADIDRQLKLLKDAYEEMEAEEEQAAALLQQSSVKVVKATSSIELTKESDVVALLEEIKTQVESDLASDNKAYANISAWCSKTKNEKETSIESQEDRKVQLTTQMETHQQTQVQLDLQIKKLEASMKEHDDSAKQAETLRVKSNKAFTKSSKEMKESIGALDNAVDRLKQKSEEAAMVEVVKNVQNVLKNQKAVTLSDEVQAMLAKAPKEALMLMNINRGKPLSGAAEVHGLLSGIKDTFESDLKTAEEKEEADKQTYEELKENKEKQRDSMQENLESKLEQLAAAKESQAQAKADLEFLNEALEADGKYVDGVKEHCKKSQEDFVLRNTTRIEEIESLESAIDILNSPAPTPAPNETESAAAMALEKVKAVKKTEVKKTKAAVEKEKAPLSSQEASNILEKYAKKGSKAVSFIAREQSISKHGAQNMSLQEEVLAARIREQMKKVLEEMDKMHATLKDEKAAEVELKDVCIEETNKAVAAIKSRESQKANLVVVVDRDAMRVSDAKQALKECGVEIEEFNASIASAGEVRAEEESNYAENMEKSNAHQAKVTNAIEALKAFYDKKSFLQVADKPTFDKELSKNGGGTGAVAMLEHMLEKSNRVIDSLRSTEKSAQDAYKVSLMNIRLSIEAKNKEMITLRASLGAAEALLVDAQAELADLNTEIKEYEEFTKTLSTKCNAFLANFEHNQEHRAKEIEQMVSGKTVIQGLIDAKTPAPTAMLLSQNLRGRHGNF